MPLERGLMMLSEAGSAVDTEENRTTLRQNAGYAEALARGLKALANADLLTPDNRATFVANVQHYSLDAVLDILANTNTNFLTQDRFTSLMQNAEHAYSLCSGFMSLNAVSQMNQENFSTLIQNAEYARQIGYGLAELVRSNVLTPENRLILVQNAPHAIGLGSGLRALADANILTPGNRLFLINNAQHSTALGSGLATLAFVGILTQENFNALSQNIQYADDVVNEMMFLNRARILTQANFDSLIQYAAQSSSLRQELCDRANNGSLTQERFSAMIQRVQGVSTQNTHIPEHVNETTLHNIGFPDDLIPEKYVCELMGCIMDNPVTLPETHKICNRADIVKAIKSIGDKDPFNRQPLSVNQLVPENALKTEIEKYVKYIDEAVKEKKGALGKDEYEKIQTAVTVRIDREKGQMPPPQPPLLQPQPPQQQVSSGFKMHK